MGTRDPRPAIEVDDHLVIRLGVRSDKYVKIDVEDRWIEKHQWHLGWTGYAITNIEKRPTPMHRILMQAPKGVEVDHINHDKLDNRRENLRLVTHAQNMWNQQKRADNKSGFRGVSWSSRKRKFVAQIKVNGQHYFLGHYDSPADASKAYETKSKELHGVYKFGNAR